MKKLAAPLKVKVWGDYALFTRPEAKVERVSYPVMTPSAARGILESIYWKPEFKYLIKKIHVLNPIQYYSILRNEVESVVPGNIAKKGKEFLADKYRQKRHSIMLRNVAYIIETDIKLMDYAEDNPTKHREIFRRRVAKGQCFHQPYLGTRECSAFFSEPKLDERPITISEELGPMLFDIKFQKNPNDQAIPYFFEAILENGVLNVPLYLYEEVYR